MATGSYQRQTTQVGGAIDAVRAANPEAVVAVGPANTVAPILKQAHAKGWKPLFLSVSFVGTDDLIQEAGSDAEGVVVTQVVPPYYLTEYRTVALYRRTLAKYYPSAQPNFVSLEGFVDAMVLVEGLKKAGKDLTREGLIHGIESIHDLDIGLGPPTQTGLWSERPPGLRPCNPNGRARRPRRSVHRLVHRRTKMSSGPPSSDPRARNIFHPGFAKIM